MPKQRLPSQPKISVVVISRNEGLHLRRTIDNLDDTLPAGHEVLVIDDGSTDGSTKRLTRRRSRIRLIRCSGLGVTRARNLGACRTDGQVVVFADAHLEFQKDWWKPVLDLLRRSEVGAVAPVIVNTAEIPLTGYGLTFRSPAMEVRWLKQRRKDPVPVPILPGCCLAMRRDVLAATGGWDGGMLQRGNVDNEFSVRHWLLGYELLVTPETVVGHLFRRHSPYPVGWPEYLHNRLRLAFVHFNARRIAKVVAALRAERRFGEALLLIAKSDAAERRGQLLQSRLHDDDWFFDRFGIAW